MSAPLQRVADEVREIALADLLAWHGFKLKREGVSFRAKTDRYNIVITGQKWFDNKAGTGGAGAIDLQMHLCGGDFQTTCLVLANDFRPLAGRRLEFPPETRSRTEPPKATFDELAAKYAVPSKMNWPVAHDYLVETRKIDSSLIDELHDTGAIYANAHTPNPGIVFLHRSHQGKVEGATLRDTRDDSSFRPTLGNKLTAWFCVGDLANAEKIVAVESPIDALSYHSLFIGKNDPTAVVSCAGSNISTDLMFEAYERKQRFVVALDNDAAGERGWRRAWDETVDWTGFEITSACPQRKDWNDDLVAHALAPKSIRRSLHSLTNS
jgi:hypothetical protein